MFFAATQEIFLLEPLLNPDPHIGSNGESQAIGQAVERVRHVVHD
jgi:hypothetical protein